MTKNSFTKEYRDIYFASYIQYSSDLSIDEDLIFSQEELKDLRKSMVFEYLD